MEFKYVSKNIAGAGKVFITVMIVLIAVTVIQLIAAETIGMFVHTQHPAETKSEPQLTDEEKRLDRIAGSSKEFLSDGTIHLVGGPRFKPGQVSQPGTVQIYDANDNLLWEGPNDQRPYKYLLWAEALSVYDEAFRASEMKKMQMIGLLFSRTIEVPVGSVNNTRQVWRYCPGKECFEGYAIAGGERIGYISATGFTDSKSKAKPLGEFRLFTAWTPRDSSSPTLLWQTNRRVYQINFEKQQVELLFESPNSDIEEIYLHAWKDLRPGAEGYIDTEKYQPLIVCITEDGTHHLILREPDQQLSFGGPRCSVTVTRQGIYALRNSADAVPPPPIGASEALLKDWFEQYRNKPQKKWTELYKVSNDGGLELVNRYEWTSPASRRRAQTESVTSALRFVTHFSPALYNLALRLTTRGFWAYVDRSASQGDSLWGILQAIVYLRPLNNTVNLTLSALMMGFVFWHGLPRRTSNARFAFWLVFVGLFNLTALLTYLAMNYTAAIRCPVCGRRRGLAQSDCVRCMAPLPAPKPRDLDLILTNQ